jgi:hypothetical protein
LTIPTSLPFSSFTASPSPSPNALSAHERIKRRETRRSNRSERNATIGPKRPNGDYDWQKILYQYILPITERQIAPNSNRGIMYILVSKNVILKKSYDGLTRILVWARKKGIIPWDAISDDSGRGIINDIPLYISPISWVNNVVSYAKNTSENYLSHLYKWYCQPDYIEFWIEKMALARTVAAYVGDMQVAVVYDKGNTGWGFMHENCERIKNELIGQPVDNPVVSKALDIRRKKVYIYYLGDADKHGRQMFYQIKDQLKFFEIDNRIHFESIAITDEQISKYNLPENFELSKDGKPKGGVQLDALQAFKPYEFQNLIQSTIRKHFKPKIYNQMLAEHQPGFIDGLMARQVKFLRG